MTNSGRGVEEDVEKVMFLLCIDSEQFLHENLFVQGFNFKRKCIHYMQVYFYLLIFFYGFLIDLEITSRGKTIRDPG